MALCQANFDLNEQKQAQISSTINIYKYVEQLQINIALLNNTAIENENEINYLKKEISNQLNKRFDELIDASNSKINEQKQHLLSQINELKSYESLNDAQLNQKQTNINHYTNVIVNIDYNKKEIFDFIKKFGNIVDTKIEYKIIPDTGDYSMHEKRYKNECNTYDTFNDVITSKNQSFTQYTTFDDFDMSLTKFFCSTNNKLKLKALETMCFKNNKPYCQKILNSKLVEKLHEILDSNNTELQLKSLEILSQINTNMISNDFDQIFNENSISILINVINTNEHQSKTTNHALHILWKLIPTFKQPMLLQNKILDCLLMVSGPNMSKIVYNIIVDILFKLCEHSLRINKKYIIKILQIFCILVRYVNHINFNIQLIDIYDLLNTINENMELFDGDIVLDGYSFTQKYNKLYFKLLVSGFIRRNTNASVIPNDIAFKCAMFMNYGAFPIEQLLCSKQYPFLVRLLNKAIDSTNNKRRLQAVQLIRQVTTVKDPPLQTIINTAGMIPKLVQFLQCDGNIDHDCLLQMEVTYIFANVCSGTEEQTQCIIDIGAIPLVINLIKSPSYAVQDCAIWTLANIAGTNVSSRNLVLNNEILQQLLPICKNHLKLKNNNAGLVILTNISWVIFTLLYGTRPVWKYIEQILECLFYLLKINDTEILWNSAYAFRQLTDHISGDSDILVTTIKNMGFLKLFVDLLDNDAVKVQYQTLVSINNILEKTNMLAVDVIHCGVLKKLHALFTQSKGDHFQKVCVGIVSNIFDTTDSANLLEEVIKANIFPIFVDILQNNEKFATEALQTIIGAIDCSTNEQISYLVNLNVIPAICGHLKTMKLLTTDIVFESLNCLEQILIKCGENENEEYKNEIEKCGGLETLKLIQSDDQFSETIQETVFNILQWYS